MDIRKVVVAGLLVVGLVVAVGAALVRPAARNGPPVGSASQPLTPSLSEAGAPAGVGAVAAAAPADPAPFARATPPGAKTATGVVPKAAQQARGPAGSVRREELRAIRRDLIAGFAELRRQVEECGAESASFVLALEAAAGAVRVQGARLEFKGSAPDAAVACAQSALRGKVIRAPGVDAGRRWEAPL